ncbi:hypothetical protein ACWGJB_37675 [Streptomyces sp. NPDC054813]
MVVHRGSPAIRVFGWISGDRYRLGRSRQSAYSITCGSCDDKTGNSAALGADYVSARAVGRLEGCADRVVVEPELPRQCYSSLAVVVEDPGPFCLTGDNHRGVIYQATAVLAPDRDVTFVRWGYLGASLPMRATIGSTSSRRCLTDGD